MRKIQLTEIHIYPIKSTTGISLLESKVQPEGLYKDRRWMLVDERGKFITGRQNGRLTQIRSRLTSKGLQVDYPGMNTLTLPERPNVWFRKEVYIWKDSCDAVWFNEEYSEWFSEALGQPCSLVYMDNNCIRPVAPEYSEPSDSVSFADGYPLLIISEASLEELNSRLTTPVTMAHFRPNLVVSGCEAFAEDDWKEIRIGNVIFRGGPPCARCVFTTVDPTTGKRSSNGEPLKTLKTYRRKKSFKDVYFGQNLISTEEGSIQLHDQIEIIS